jgi:hypothetical protein
MLEVGKFYIEPEQSALILILDIDRRERVYVDYIFVTSASTFEAGNFNEHPDSEDEYEEVPVSRHHRLIMEGCVEAVFEDYYG